MRLLSSFSSNHSLLSAAIPLTNQYNLPLWFLRPILDVFGHDKFKWIVLLTTNVVEVIMLIDSESNGRLVQYDIAGAFPIGAG